MHAQVESSAQKPGVPVLAADGLSKSFGSVRALQNVNFELAAGEVHALCGENGAGKSTLIKTLSCTYGHGTYEGRILMSGAEQKFGSVPDAEGAGLSVIHQELALVPEMTVAENIFLGHEPTRGWFVDHERMYRESTEVLNAFGLDLPANARIEDLGVGQKQLVEIAKALHRRSRILILDEPTAALTETEVDVLLNIIRDLSARGVSCVYISHKLDEVVAIAHRVTVLRDGSTIETLSNSHWVTPETKHLTLEQWKTRDVVAFQDEIVKRMVGRPIADLFPRKRTPPGDVLLEVKNLSVAELPGGEARLADISLTLRAGEVLGIGGLMGAGRSELLMHLFGAWGVRLNGTAQLKGAALANTPRGCIEQGFALVSEDRKRYGLVLEQSVAFNLSLSALPSLCDYGVVDEERELAENRKYISTLAIKIAHPEIAVNTLSGGNQQKVVIGKVLMTGPRVVLLDEPTRGIDVGAKLEIYELINKLTDQGVAVLLVSSELPELMGMSDRIMMLAEGRIGGTFDSAPFEQGALLKAAMRAKSARGSTATEAV